MKKKVILFCISMIIVVVLATQVFAMTGADLKSLCSSSEEPIISQYLSDDIDYPVITENDLDSDDQTMLEAVVVGENGEEYIIIIVNGEIHILQK
ncbi:MAG TPA: hypothetical protein ENG70_04925 [Candidatus Cloacimonetes bacterium]|nr:hypothetical protein [Candidatus Cloacimonadota bacterium]HEX38181.1 hypothetical protein [Candidatus Cloacimonadota bacterium]